MLVPASKHVIKSVFGLNVGGIFKWRALSDLPLCSYMICIKRECSIFIIATSCTISSEQFFKTNNNDQIS